MVKKEDRMKKILFLYNYASPNTRIWKLNSFSWVPYIVAKEMGYEFHINTNSEEVIQKNSDLEVYYHVIGIYRNPLSKETFIAYKKLRELLKQEKFDAIHCNTPIGGMLGRICGKQAGINNIIYEAHGFHFFKGAPLKNWLLYYPAERLMAHWTDTIITMNNEDYDVAQKMHLRKKGQVYKVHGVGIDLKEYDNIVCNKTEKKKELGLKESDFICISAGDLVKRKNYEVAIKSIAKINNVHYLICGVGPERERLELLAKNEQVEDRVHFLGFRKDIKELMKISDVFLFTSLQEGLPRSLMEAMACGLPCIVSNIRGNIDLLDEGKGGYLCGSNAVDQISEKVFELMNNDELKKSMGIYNQKQIKNYDISVVHKEISEIYKNVLC